MPTQESPTFANPAKDGAPARPPRLFVSDGRARSRKVVITLDYRSVGHAALRVLRVFWARQELLRGVRRYCFQRRPHRSGKARASGRAQSRGPRPRGAPKNLNLPEEAVKYASPFPG